MQLRYAHTDTSVTAYLGDEQIGRLVYENDGDGTAFVASVDVREGYRRRGVASAMADYLWDVVGLVPTHAPRNCGNTPDGDAWVAAYTTRRH